MCVLAAATSPHGRNQQGVLYPALLATMVEYLAISNSQQSVVGGGELWQAVAEAAGSSSPVAGVLTFCQEKLDKALVHTIQHSGIDRSDCTSETLKHSVDACCRVIISFYCCSEEATPYRALCSSHCNKCFYIVYCCS